MRAGSMRQETIYPLKEIIEGLDDRLATGNAASSMYTTAANALKIFSNRNMAALTARDHLLLASSVRSFLGAHAVRRLCHAV